MTPHVMIECGRLAHEYEYKNHGCFQAESVLLAASMNKPDC